jgi:drug/metabolite transporter (DMT)-like permease
VLVVALIAAGAVGHAAWNLVVKHAALSGPAFVWLTSAVSAVLLVPVALVVAAFEPPSLPELALAASVSGCLHVAYFLTLQAGYRVGDVSVVYPLARGTGPLLSVLLAIPLLGERPGWLGLVGALLVVIGVVIIGLAGGRGHWSRARPGALWGLAVGVTIAAYTLWDASAVTVLSLAPVVLFAGSACVQALVLAPLALRDRARTRQVVRTRWREVLVVAVLSPLAYILILTAFQLAPVSIVAPAREVSVVLVGIAGWLLFREPHPVQRLLGAAVVLGGVALLATAH